MGACTHGAAPPIAVNATGTQVKAIACAPPTLHSSGEAATTYTLQLAQPFLASLDSKGTGQPGWGWSGSGLPNTTMTIPNGAKTPYGPFQAQQVEDLPCTGPTTCTGAPYQLADYLCWAQNAVAACGCAAANQVPVTPSNPAPSLPTTADVNPGDKLSVIACQSTPPVNAPGAFKASAVTTVQF
jgi:LysM repeat protein